MKNRKVIKLLKKFIRTKKVKDTSKGLCDNMQLRRIEKYKMAGIIAYWEEFSGCLVFPVPSSSTKQSPLAYYCSSKNLYRGKQLELRLSLAEHILSVLE